MRGRAAALLALLVATGAVAGCGGGVKEANRYVDATNAVERRFAVDIDRMASGAPTRAALAQYAAAAQELVSGLRAIAPPARVRALHGRLVATATRFQARLAQATGDLESHDATRVLDGQQELPEAVTDVLRSLDATSGAINRTLHGGS